MKTRARIDDDWTEKIKQEIYMHWLDRIEKENPILQGDPISNYNARKRDLAKLMEEKLSLIHI